MEPEKELRATKDDARRGVSDAYGGSATMSLRMPMEPESDVRSTKDDDRLAPPPVWTAPDFVEKSVCAEIGAYAFAEA
jgi:hypothetical protein